MFEKSVTGAEMEHKRAVSRHAMPSFFLGKAIGLPRQARDKHVSEKLEQRCVLCTKGYESVESLPRVMTLAADGKAIVYCELHNN